jgi:flagellar basal-body rod protein FlgF
MLRGVYAAAAGMVAEMRRQQSVANNLANMGTEGYKQDGAALAAFPAMLIQRTGPQPAQVGMLGTGVLATGKVLDLSQGPLKDTGNPLDLAISGQGFFAVQTAEGERYTRAGTFKVGQDGILCTQKGDPVLGEQGTLKVPEGAAVEVAPDGTVSADGKTLGRLLIMNSARPENMSKIGDNLFTAAPGSATQVQPGDARVVQGFTEEANVDGASAVVEAMSALRAYEAAQRVLKMQDQTLSRAIDEVGKA